jgi:hypothetical protein
MRQEPRYFHAALLLVAILLAAADLRAEWTGGGRPVAGDPSGPIMVLAGEEFYLTPGTAKGAEGTVSGDAVKYLGKDEAGGTMRYGFMAVSPGTAKLEFKPAGAKSGAVRQEVKVLGESDVPALTVAELQAKPKPYVHRLFRLTGDNRGWGLPQKAKSVWGAQLTKSDWVFEDDTGAVHVTGSTLPTENRLVLIATLNPAGKEYAVWSVHERDAGAPAETPRPDKSAPAAPDGKADLKLDPGRVNEMKVGQTGLIEVYPDKSHEMKYEIAGSVLSVAGEDRDRLVVKAGKAGESEVKIFLVHWREIVPPEITGAPAPKPRAVYRVQVVP